MYVYIFMYVCTCIYSCIYSYNVCSICARYRKRFLSPRILWRSPGDLPGIQGLVPNNYASGSQNTKFESVLTFSFHNVFDCYHLFYVLRLDTKSQCEHKTAPRDRRGRP